MQTKKSQPEGKRIMSEMRFTEFPALSVDLRVGISRSASESDDSVVVTSPKLTLMATLKSCRSYLVRVRPMFDYFSNL